MSYCINPDCPKPKNPETNKFCQECGFNLLLQGRYRAIELIAQGGFSRTFLAVDEGQSPSSVCVLKQLWTQNLTPDALQKAIALFQQEILRLEQLGKHPQIPTLQAHFEQNQHLYLVQEFIDGKNLARVVEEEGTFSETQIWQLLNDLLPVLKFIHDHQVIHRDIKPENIIRRTGVRGNTVELTSPPAPLLQGEGSSIPPFPCREGGSGGLGLPYPNSLRVKGSQIVLIDFGAAKQVAVREALKTGTCIGSPEYVAPEQARGKAVFASDLYSLGVSCIYLLTGISPFDLFDVVNDRWVWRDYLTQEVSAGLTEILDKLLQNAIACRFQSVDEVVQAMKQLRNDRTSTPSNYDFRASTKVPPTDSGHLPGVSLPTQKWQCLHTLAGKLGINSVAISPDSDRAALAPERSEPFRASGRLLVSSSDDKSVRLWNLDTGLAISTLTGHSQSVKSLAFNPDGTILATGSDDQTVKLWNLNTHQEICTFSGHSHAFKSVAFSPQGNLLASGSWDKTIKLWNVQTGVQETTLTGHGLQVASVAFSPCGKFLASASYDRTVRLWELSSGLSCTFEGHSWAVFTVAFSPDGKTLATGGDDNTVILWDLKTGKPLYTLLAHCWSVVAVAFSPDGETLVSGSWDKTIKLWKVSTGQEIATLAGHVDSVSSVAISPCGQIIASGSKDKTIKLWHRVG